ncbi:ATP-dependent helicase/DNAse subunit B [Sporomusaceae bacterium BoRhaA]|uniref:PD-(D/E)XK nuclease family protein n=1 Tax=Pelorhabdus rhamnosifermentans TaxID=2772457 RepID=UPI001C0625FA|nr:PD-(D/E)XK nuclease family protein [Pelorhabdus rhamnosifermentans]MBU2703444.1 ATP-dependent helicase/DNAse subunit B [Pelorhabdus rhamnosifermentans]
MYNLYCLALGESYRGEFIRQMLNSIHHDIGSTSLLMLPNSQLLDEVRQEVLEQDPESLTKLNLLSFDDLITLILDRSGKKPSFMSRMTQELLVKQIVHELIKQGELPYFCEMSHFPGFIRTITSFIGELKRTGTTAAEWQSASEAKGSEFGSISQKDAEMTLIYLEYQAALTRFNVADLEERYFLASEVLRENPALLPYESIYFSEFYILTPLQLSVIRLMKQGRDISVALVYEKNRPELYHAVEETYTALIGQDFVAKFVARHERSARCLDYLVENIFTEQAVEKQVAPCITYVEAPHVSKELAVFGAKLKSKLLGGKIRPSDVAIIVRNMENYRSLRSLFGELKIPLGLRWEEKLERQPLVQLLFDYMAARLAGGNKKTVQKLWSSSLVAAKYGVDKDRILADSKSFRMDGWSGWLDFCQSDGKLKEQIEQLRLQVESLPLQGTAQVINQALSDLIRALHPLEYFGLKHRQGKLPLVRLKAYYLTYQALERTGQELETELASLGQENQTMTLKEYGQLFLQLLSAKPLQLAEGDKQGVKVMSPAGARGVNYEFVAILGLTEGEFPKQIRENWLYSDAERKLFNDLGIPLPMAVKHRLEEKFYFAVSLSLARSNLYLSGLVTNEALLSPFLAEVERIVDILPENRAVFTVDEMFPACYESIYTQQEYTQKAIYDFYHSGGGEGEKRLAELIFQHFEISDFRRKVAAEISRKNDCNSPFSGYVPGWQKANGSPVSDENQVWSISRLEDYLKCPFAYFLKHVLCLDQDTEADEVTEPSLMGELYHDILASFLAGYCGLNFKQAEQASYQAVLLEKLDQVIHEWVRNGKIRPGKFWFYERERFVRVLTNWLHYEVERQQKSSVSLRPAHLEWGFGLPVTQGMDEGSVTTPLTLFFGQRKIFFRGKVDRVDKTEQSYAVYDYKKSGSPLVQDTVEYGTDLQIPLYIAAVQQLLARDSGKVIGGSYYSIEKHVVQGGIWHKDYQKSLGPTKITGKSFMSQEGWTQFYEEFGKRIIAAVDAIHCGEFPIRPSQGCLDYCLGKVLCRKEGR